MSEIAPADMYAILSINQVDFNNSYSTLNGKFGSSSFPMNYTNVTANYGYDIDSPTYSAAVAGATGGYNSLTSQTYTPINNILDGQTLGPGYYTPNTSNTFFKLNDNATLTLNGSGLYAFYGNVPVNSGYTSFIIGDGTITLNGADPSEIYWLSPGSFNIYIANKSFYGHIISKDNIQIVNNDLTFNGSVINIGSVTPPFSFSPNTYTFNTAEPLCLHPDTLVKTVSGNIPIKNIRSGDFVLDRNGNMHQVIYNIKLKQVTNWVQISKNALGLNVPENDLFISYTHPLLINNRYVYPIDLINNKTIFLIKLPPVNMYSICTLNQEFVMIEGMNVSTWRQTDFESTIIYRNDLYEKI